MTLKNPHGGGIGSSSAEIRADWSVVTAPGCSMNLDGDGKRLLMKKRGNVDIGTDILLA